MMDEHSLSFSWYREELEIVKLDEQEGIRHGVYDPKSDSLILINLMTLNIAKLFDGKSSHEQICTHILNNYNIEITQERLIALESKLISLSILKTNEHNDQKNHFFDRAIKDPNSLFKISIIIINPEDFLNMLYKIIPWVGSYYFFLLSCLFFLVCSLFLYINFDNFLYDIARIYTMDFNWIFLHYILTIFSIFIHELGHAISCRYFNVQTKKICVFLFLLLPQGSTRPNQLQWSRLGFKEKMTTICMGSHASIIYAAIGIVIWLLASNVLLRDIGVIMAVGSVTILLPTLTPFIKGDMWLAIQEIKKRSLT